MQTTDAEMGQTQGARPIGDSVTATLKKETVIPVLSVLRDYAKTRRPDLTRLLDSVELVVPGGSDPNAAAFHWGHSNIVTVNLPLLLDFTELAELVAVSSTAHPAAEAVYSRTLGTYEAYLKALHPGSMGGEAWIIYRSLRRSLADSLDVDSISDIGKIVRRDIVAWAVLHEISHHILGHTALNDIHQSLAESRKQELDADVSAFRLLNDLGLGLTNLRSFLELRARMEPMLIEHGYEPQEDKSDHPSWATRLRALNSYMTSNSPPKTPWIAFGVDKFVADERLAGAYELISLHYIFPTQPAEWSDIAFSTNRYISPIAVAFKNGEVHLYWRSDVFLSHLVIETPYAHSSSETMTITTVPDGKHYTSHGLMVRDSAFRWQPGGLVAGVSLSEFQSVPLKEGLLRNARSVVQDPETLDKIDRLIGELVKSDGAAFLDYAKGSIAREQYLHAIQLAYRGMAERVSMLIGQQRSARFLALIMEGPYYKARDLRREELGLPP